MNDTIVIRDEDGTTTVVEVTDPPSEPPELTEDDLEALSRVAPGNPVLPPLSYER